MSSIPPNAPGEAPAWQLVAPDWQALDTLWQNPLPFVLWPVGPQSLLAHWMDEAVQRGAERVELYVADRPAEVRALLEGGAYWSRRLRVVPLARESEAPAGALRLTGMPGAEAGTLPCDGASLLAHWFSLQTNWLRQRAGEAAGIDEQHPSGGWVGPQARIHPTAKLVAPFWIGAQVKIGAGCQVGPNVLIGARAEIDDGALVRDAVVLERTYLGPHTELLNAAATGGTLLHFTNGCRVDIAERFIIGPVAGHGPARSLVQRFAALLLFLLLAPWAALRCRAWETREIVGAGGRLLALRTGRSGPLWIRRWPWLAQIARGQLRWVGVLPRQIADWERMPAELAAPVRASEMGLLSLADVHGCHDPADPEEWIHAIYQAQQADSGVTGSILRNFWKIAWSKTASAT